MAGLASPRFSPRNWKGGALAPPLQGLLDYSRASRPAQLAAASCAGRTESGSRDFGGAEAPPFRQPPKALQRGEKSALVTQRASPKTSERGEKSGIGNASTKGRTAAGQVCVLRSGERVASINRNPSRPAIISVKRVRSGAKCESAPATAPPAKLPRNCSVL